MKKELIIVVIIIICVIIASVLSQNNTKKQIADINGKLENLKEEVIQKEKTHTEFTSEINNIFDDWVEKDKLFSIYLEHNELEKVNVYLKTAKGFLEANEIEESVPEIEGCIAILEHIEEKQAFNLKNIF